MHLSFLFFVGSWLLAVCMGTATATPQTNHTGTLDLDLVFPLNTTYTPTRIFPIIFAFSNPSLAPYVKPYITYQIFGPDTDPATNPPTTTSHDLRWANFTSSGTNNNSGSGSGSNLYFEYRPVTGRFNVEGSWRLFWTLGWASCAEDQTSPSPRLVGHNREGELTFSTSKVGGRGVDIATSSSLPPLSLEEEEGCSTGADINILGTLLAGSDWKGPGDRCAVVDEAEEKARAEKEWEEEKKEMEEWRESMVDTVTESEPCRVRIGEEAAESMVAAMTERLCGYATAVDSGLISCPAGKKESAGQSGVRVGGWRGWWLLLLLFLGPWCMVWLWYEG